MREKLGGERDTDGETEKEIGEEGEGKVVERQTRRENEHKARNNAHARNYATVIYRSLRDNSIFITF